MKKIQSYQQENSKHELKDDILEYFIKDNGQSNMGCQASSKEEASSKTNVGRGKKIRESKSKESMRKEKDNNLVALPGLMK